MAAVELNEMTKVYDGATDAALDRFDLSIADGEFVVFVGPSGCGKSTALRMYPHMTVERNLDYPLRIAGVDKAEIQERVDQIARTLQLTELLKRKPSQFAPTSVVGPGDECTVRFDVSKLHFFDGDTGKRIDRA